MKKNAGIIAVLSLCFLLPFLVGAQQLPNVGTGADFVFNGASANDTIYFDGTTWLDSSALTNDGTDIGVSGTLTATTGVNTPVVEVASATLHLRTTTGNAVVISTGSTGRWQVSSAGHFYSQSDGTYHIGASGLSRPGTVYVATEVVSPSVAVDNNAEGNTAQMTVTSSTDTVTLSGATTDSTTISIPSGALAFGCSFTVNTEVIDSAGDDTWDADFITGDASSLASGAAKTVNTKVDTILVPVKTTDVTQVQFTPNGGNFTQGVIEIVCYYFDLTSLANV